MASEQAVPEQQQEKRHGDKLDAVLDGALNKGTGLSQDPSTKTGTASERTPAEESLK